MPGCMPLTVTFLVGRSQRIAKHLMMFGGFGSRIVEMSNGFVVITIREFGANVRRPAVKRQPRVVPNSFLYSTNGSEAWAVHSKMTWARVFLRKTDW